METTVTDEGALLVTPPFKRGNFQFNTKENEDGYAIAMLRVHVERAIGRLKRFKILKSFKREFLGSTADKIVCVICFLANNFPDLIKTKPSGPSAQ